MAGGQTFFDMMGVSHHHAHVVGGAVTAVALTGIGLLVRAKASDTEKNIKPSAGISVVNVACSVVAYIKGIVDSIVGHGHDNLIPFIGSIFLFILLNNISGLFPGWLPATDSLNTNAAIAICVFVFYNTLGLKEHGFHYFKQFTGGLPPPGYGAGITIVLALIAGLVFVIETIGHIFRPLSLSFRLWGNMTGDHILLGTTSGLVPLILPIVAMALGLFVAVVQALVFSLLTTVYIKLAVSHDH